MSAGTLKLLPLRGVHRSMQPYRRRRATRRGFTLVEVLIVVAIVGILATLASYGVGRYAASSKSAEALVNLGGIARAVRAAATRETMSASVLGDDQGTSNEGAGNSNNSGSSGNGNGNGSGKGSGKGNSGSSGNGNGNGNGATVTRSVPGLCLTATSVPSSMNSVQGKKYQPSAAPGADYNTGDRFTGWRCLMFSLDSPQFYQYRYRVGGPPVNVTLPHGGTPPGLDQDHTWSAAAQGDIDGDGQTSWFVLQGYIKDDRTVVQAPAIASENPEE